MPAVGEKRFTVAALDLGIKTMTPLRLAERGIETHVLPAASTVEHVLATGADGVFLSNGPGDPATADHAVALTADAARPPGAGVRHLLRQPDPRPGARPGHLQARATATGASTSRCRTAPPARSRSPRTTTASPSTRPPRRPSTPRSARRGQPRLPQRRRRRGAALPRRAGVLGAVPPGGRGRPARRGVPVRPVRDLARKEPADAEAHRHPQRPGHRLRADRHRPGLRVRLLRHPGLPGAARGGPAGRPGQLQPGDDHDRPGVRRRHLHRADHPRDRRQGHREGAARRAARHPRRPDRAEHRDGAARGRRARGVRRRADRRERRRRSRRGRTASSSRRSSPASAPSRRAA